MARQLERLSDMLDPTQTHQRHAETWTAVSPFCRTSPVAGCLAVKVCHRCGQRRQYKPCGHTRKRGGKSQQCSLTGAQGWVCVSQAV